MNYNKKDVYLIPLFVLTFLLIFLPLSKAEDNGCVSCHRGLDGEAQKAVIEWETSVHKQEEIYCQDCHGGNPMEAEDMDAAMYEAKGFIGVPDRKDIPKLCAKCHSDPVRMKKYNLRTDQYALYKTSIHGKRLAKGDGNVAVCTSCHGKHNIKKISDPSSSVYHTNVPETCAKCHADEKLMSQYGIKADQYKLYLEGYHGRILKGKIEGKNPSLVPTCASCHGNHGATPPGIKDIADVCGNCHGVIVDKFKQGPHYESLKKTGSPKCYDCHGNHRNKALTPEMFQGVEAGHCGACHQSPEVTELAKDIYTLILDTRAKIDEAESEYKSIEFSGRNNQDIEDLLNEAETYYKEIGPLTHSLSPQRIAELNTKIVENVNKVEMITGEFKKNLAIRKTNLIYYLIIITIIIILLYVKLRMVTIEYEQKQRMGEQ
ncbi:MAG: hypothetical protein D6734_12820 [Candidatus Schekmanbacteria bacterium]|nr:MAG: hypothetical protein D6734_12820 [Candidatus Schekmanbacteria bacterium]